VRAGKDSKGSGRRETKETRTKETSTVYATDSMVTLTLARMPSMRGRSSILYSFNIW